MNPKIPPPQPIPDPPIYADAAQAAQKIRNQPKMRTIMTAPYGDTSAAPVAQKTLMGQ